ncbi:sugar O-acetyltransferase [Ruicaihuangia caeni]|uniref:Sugar O-acetyltransferase n=1 Tax=Ruicaihuangia caeni TaxID=3042517 RepID=A0AAW6TAW5_9MICO|nr:sugar O-acetyltransferase [Klugiella sp. YN-L-19]MDI2099589.1 sugar O-acetyltransferase [Klugiella sp. YN-L-19]
MLAGDHYIADEPAFAEATQRAITLTRRYAEEFVSDAVRARETLASLLGALGEGAQIRPPLYVDYGSRLFVGAGTFANYNLTALDVAPITIGERCQLGPSVQLLTPTHPLDPAVRAAGWESAEPITIGDNVWIGGGAIVLAGVTIGDNSVIGAGSVVTRDIPANVVAVGSPARVVRSL